MQAKLVKQAFSAALLVYTVIPLFGRNGPDSSDVRALIQEGNQALAEKRYPEAAQAFQRAIDLNPSSAKANEGLGVALFRRLSDGNVRPSAIRDVAERAETHLQLAAQLSPSDPSPLSELSALNALLADRSSDRDERAERYRKAQDSLKQLISLQPSRPKDYLRLANLERDEFGPPIQQAAGRFSKTAGPIPDVNVRHSLQQQYGALLNDAITNAKRASDMNGSAQGPLLLLSQLFRERALLRDTQGQYSADMHSAADWRRQFLAVGGHTNGDPDTQN